MNKIQKYIKNKNKEEEKKLIKLLNNHTNEILKKISEKYNINISDLKNEFIIEVQKNKSKRKTGYNIFMAATAINDEIKEKFPDLNNKELLIKKSRMWKKISQEQRDYYNLLAKSNN